MLVWDAPNLDMGLGSILGRRPTALERPRFDALGRWLLARTAEIVAGVAGMVGRGVQHTTGNEPVCDQGHGGRL